ncbi:MAG: hypothetical protein GX292_04815 [Bacteroidales bacterium]|jgi:hypothetical protein|nr:hypothetical protein [Bacteroidales bacterium]
MRNKLILLVITLIFSFRCVSQNLVNYQYEALLYRYINTYCKDSILEEDYMLFTYRTVGVCQNCYRISMDSLLTKAYNEKEDYPLYVLFDNISELERIKSKYGNSIKYLLESHFVMNQYGFSITVPALFVFNKHKLVKYIRCSRK